MNFLLTGATGFIGRRLAARLVGKGRTVTALIRDPKALRIEGVRAVRCDLLDASVVRAAVPKNLDVVFHLASQADVAASVRDPASTVRGNLDMLLHLLETLRSRPKPPLVIFASTDRQYGCTARATVDEDEPPFPIEPYTASKIMCETLLKAYAHLYGISYIILRLDSVYGPGQPATMFIGDVIRKMLASDDVTVGTLAVRKNFVFVDDVVEAFVRAARAPLKARNAAYTIGGKHASLQSIVTILCRIFAAEYDRRIAVRSTSTVAVRKGFEVRPFRLSTRRAEQMLGWHPRVALPAGLNATIRYFAAHEEKTHRS